MTEKPNSQPAEKLRILAKIAATEAFSTKPDLNALLHVANELEQRAQRFERTMPAIAVLPPNATEAETRQKRRVQATQVGKDVYLPIWQKVMGVMPSSFLRSALFSTSNDVQEMWTDKLKQPLIVVDKKIATTTEVTMTLSGYELCQFDRRVYATCLNFYRERPLAKESDDYVETSFYLFAKEMGSHYGENPHIAIRASLLRLSLAQIRLRSKRINLELPKLLSATFEDGESNGVYKGSDQILLQIPAAIAELFGRGDWTVIDTLNSRADGVRGWVGCFYATHSKEWQLSLEHLHHLSGYTSHMRNFTRSLTSSLDRLKELPNGLVRSYKFSPCGKKITVHCMGWKESQTPH